MVLRDRDASHLRDSTNTFGEWRRFLDDGAVEDVESSMDSLKEWMNSDESEQFEGLDKLLASVERNIAMCGASGKHSLFVCRSFLIFVKKVEEPVSPTWFYCCRSENFVQTFSRL